MTIKLNPLEVRIVRLLNERYPITVAELRREMSVRPAALTRALKSLEVKGVLVLEPLTDKTYVRLLVPGIQIGSQGHGKAANMGKGENGDEKDDTFTYM